MTRYALDIAGQVGEYAVLLSHPDALLAAHDLAVTGDTVTVVQVDGPADDLRFTPLVTVSPPITPPSTSPEVPA